MIFYLLAVLFLILVAWHFKKLTIKPEWGYQKEFKFNPEEKVLNQWEIYISPHQGEETGAEFFKGGKVYRFLQTNQNRLLLLNAEQAAYILDPSHLPQFRELLKKPNLSFFARVASAKVLEVKLFGQAEVMEWHVPSDFLFG